MAKLTIEVEINAKDMYLVTKDMGSVKCLHEPKLTSFDDILSIPELNINTINIIKKGKIDNVNIVYGICEHCERFYFAYDVTI